MIFINSSYFHYLSAFALALAMAWIFFFACASTFINIHSLMNHSICLLEVEAVSSAQTTSPTK